MEGVRALPVRPGIPGVAKRQRSLIEGPVEAVRTHADAYSDSFPASPDRVKGAQVAREHTRSFGRTPARAGPYAPRDGSDDARAARRPRGDVRGERPAGTDRLGRGGCRHEAARPRARRTLLRGRGEVRRRGLLRLAGEAIA